MATKRAPIKATRLTQRIIISVLVLILLILLIRIKPVSTLIFTPTKPTYIRSIYGNKSANLGLKYPQGIAVNNKKNWLYVTSAKNSRVIVFNNDYEQIFSFGEKVLRTPVFVAVSNKGMVYVTDRAQKAVLVFTENGNFIHKLKLKQLNNPLGIAVDQKDNIYLTDTGKQHQILKYSSSGKLIFRFGYKKRAALVTSAKGGFFYPNGLAVDSKENIYVADSNNGRLQVFDNEGKFKQLIITGGLPRGIAINEKANVIFVADALRHKVHLHNLQDGKLRVSFSQLGSGNQDVAFPNSVVLKGKALESLLIVDRENGRIQLFKTKLSVSDIIRLLRPGLPFALLPVLGLLLLFLVSRRRRYILTDCFLDDVLKNHHIDDLEKATRIYHVAPALFEDLSERDLISKFRGRFFQNKRYSHFFADKIRTEHKISQSQAEALALAHHRGIYQPILLACDKKMLEIAHEYRIKAYNPESFFHIRNVKK